jgi:hypothetical protein
MFYPPPPSTAIAAGASATAETLMLFFILAPFSDDFSSGFIKILCKNGKKMPLFRLHS